MSKITRRFFLGTATMVPMFLVTPMSWAKAKTAKPRAAASDLWRRFNRWRTGMKPRWIEWSSTEFVRNAHHKRVTSSRQLRWPDTDGLESPGVEWLGTTVEPLVNADPSGMEWSERELGYRLPGPKCTTPKELIDKVQHAAAYPISGAEGDEERDVWIRDAKDTVAKWELKSEDGYYYIPEWGHDDGLRKVKDWHKGMEPLDLVQVSRMLSEGVGSSPEPGQMYSGVDAPSGVVPLGYFAGITPLGTFDKGDALMERLNADALPMLQRMDERDAKRDWTGMRWMTSADGTEIVFERKDGELEMHIRKV